ncbi:MAG: Druantia anti-phage system protein DruA [Ignavibacteriota bacterium]
MAQGRPIACLAWSSAPRHLGSRDRYIGWSAEARRRNIRFIAYNTRFLILPWVRVPHLASYPSRPHGRGTFRRLVPGVQPSDLLCGNLH